MSNPTELSSTPLLTDQDESFLNLDQDEPLINQHEPPSPPPLSSASSSRSTLTRVSVFLIMNFSLGFHDTVLIAPYLSLMERALCKSYYTTEDPSLIGPGGWVPEMYCKVPGVQRELAVIRGWRSFFDTLPGEG